METDINIGKIRQLIRSEKAENQILAIELGKSVLGMPKIQVLLELFCYGKSPTDIKSLYKTFTFLNCEIEILINKSITNSSFYIRTKPKWTNKELKYIKNWKTHKINLMKGKYLFTDTSDKKFKQIIWNFYKTSLRRYYAEKSSKN